MFSKAIYNLRSRPGYIFSLTCTTTCIGYTLYQAPKFQDNIVRYAWAGTAATIICEFLTHGIDTVNMRAKVINGPKIYVLNLLKTEGFLPLLKGVQPVLYGYILSSWIYFYIYAHSKSFMHEWFIGTDV